MRADADEGVSTDELMAVSRLGPEGVRTALFDLERFGIASNDMVLTAFVHAGVERHSTRRLEEGAALEAALIGALREDAPDLGLGEFSVLHLRHSTQRLKEAGHRQALPEFLWRILRSLAADGSGEDGGRHSLELRRLDAESVQIRLQRSWHNIESTAALRREAAQRLLEHLLACLPAGLRGTDLLVQSTLGKLMQALQSDLVLHAKVRQPQKLLDHALLWLHEQEVIRLNKGLAVFRPAMTIRLNAEPRGFGKSDFQPLKLHYDELVLQIHVMAEYAQRGLDAMADALRLTVDYFTLQRGEFMSRWLPERERELARQTTPESWRAIVEALDNPVQQRIVADEREQTNVLVLAGPGSGKTRVLVHRIAYLVRVRREDPRGILALAYNRHAAVQIRRRLGELIGDDAKGVIVLTCHALAMRLVGASIERRASQADEVFRQIMQEAVDLLEGTGLPSEEADEQRSRLLAGFRWILVDEYQDIGPEQYRLISALAGRTLKDEDSRLGLFAVGDDDQNIYAFAGASVEFIRRFETDYAAKPAFLIENYRSSAHIIAAANRLIAPARQRLKAEHPIAIDRARRKAAPGGDWQRLDPVGRGRVQLLAAVDSATAQAVVAIDELQRLASLDTAWDWSRTAVIARQWDSLEPVRACCELRGIPVQMADEEMPRLFGLRETRSLLHWLRSGDSRLIDSASMLDWIAQQPVDPWWLLLCEAVEEYALDTAAAELPVDHFIDWLADWGREARRRQTGLLLLTAHRAKGLEFDHVIVLDGHWDRHGRGDDEDAPRRLLYVAMTRARKTLALTRLRPHARLLDDLPAGGNVFARVSAGPLMVAPELSRRYRRLTLSDVDISYVGSRASNDRVHARIAALRIGERLELREASGRWLLITGNDVIVGRMAASFAIEPGWSCLSVSVSAIMGRRREESMPEYASRVRCDEWEVVLCELVLGPSGLNSA